MLRKIQFGIGVREDRSTFGNCGGKKLCEIRDLLFDILVGRNVRKGKRDGA